MSSPGTTALRIIDSHTGAEPTRVVLAGGPDLGTGSMAQRLEILRRDHDWLRTALVHEPRGSSVMVGALLCEPVNPDHAAGVIFFNNVGYLGMCGHGAMGLIASLGYLGDLQPGEHYLETPVGVVKTTMHDRHRVSVENVASYRYRAAVAVEVEGFGTVRGDIAWGGNWFFLITDHGQHLDASNAEMLTDYAWRVNQSLQQQDICGPNGEPIDHVELFGPPSNPATADSRNFVLCPGMAYDRSPCGTGTSAKLACLHAAGKLQPGQTWRQEGIIGSVFNGQFSLGHNGQIQPTITGEAYVNGELSLVFEPEDPFRFGMR